MNELELLRQVARDNVTWRSDISGRVSWRLWSSETDYKTVTPLMKRLSKAGLVKRYHGHLFGRGGVELTVMGKTRLEAER